MYINNIPPTRTIRPSHCIVASVLAGVIACIGAINLIDSRAIPIWDHTASIAFVSVDGSIAVIAGLAALALQRKRVPLAQIEEKQPSKEELSDLRIPLMLHVAQKKINADLEKRIQDESFFSNLKGLDQESACKWVSNNCWFTKEKRGEILKQFQECLKICEKSGPDYTGRFKELIQFASVDPQFQPAFLTARKDKDYRSAAALLYLFR